MELLGRPGVQIPGVSSQHVSCRGQRGLQDVRPPMGEVLDRMRPWAGAPSSQEGQLSDDSVRPMAPHWANRV